MHGIEPPRADCDGYLVRGQDAAARMDPSCLARTVLVTGNETSSCPTVWVDDVVVGQLAARHLLALSPRTLVSVIQRASTRRAPTAAPAVQGALTFMREHLRNPTSLHTDGIPVQTAIPGKKQCGKDVVAHSRASRTNTT